MINIDLEFFKELIDSLRKMIDYADDGMVARTPEFEYFYSCVDKANELYDKANEILEKEDKQ